MIAELSSEYIYLFYKILFVNYISQWYFSLFPHHYLKDQGRQPIDRSRRSFSEKISLTASNSPPSIEPSLSSLTLILWCPPTTKYSRYNRGYKAFWRKWISSTWTYKTNNNMTGAWKDSKSSPQSENICLISNGTTPNIQEAIRSLV